MMVSSADADAAASTATHSLLVTRGYQQEMLKESLHRNIIIALDTGSGKTYIAVLRIKHEMEKEHTKVHLSFLPPRQRSS